MQKTSNSKIVFDNIGGSFQFHTRSAEDLRRILELDPTAWAALCVPVNSLNGDADFFKALDTDNNGMIQVDEVKNAVSWLLDILNDHSYIGNAPDSLPLNALNTRNADGKSLNDFILQHQKQTGDDVSSVSWSDIRTGIAAVSTAPLTGDGLLKLAAIPPEAAGLYTDLAALYDCQDKLTSAILEKFVLDAQIFIEWVKNTGKPLFRDRDAAEYYAKFKAIETKTDEFFRYCELIALDPAHAARFELIPDNLPALDLQNQTEITAIFQKAPLALPNAEKILRFDRINNPAYQKQCAEFAALFDLHELSSETWQKLKTEISNCRDYLEKIANDIPGKLGKEKLEEYLAGDGLTILRKLFDEDREVASVMENLNKFNRLFLYCRHLITFVNNFVGFSEFFDQNQSSMLQAGRLIMDGKSYNLAVWIDDIAAHKKIAARSNLCLLYLELVSNNCGIKRKAAVAVTGGSLDRIYIGKPAFFIDEKNRSYTGKIIDMVDGPISFGQTLFAPFRKLSAALSNKIQKLTDFSGVEKQLVQSIDKGKKVPAAPPQNNGITRKLGSNGLMMVLAGGLSLAAIGAGLSFIFKSTVSAITAISALPWYVILIWIAVFAAIILIPLGIYAFLRLRKRNLTMFLEAGGWAVNLPMRLSMNVSRLFTRGTIYPKHAVFSVLPKSNKTVTILLLLIIAAAVIFIISRYTDCIPGI